MNTVKQFGVPDLDFKELYPDVLQDVRECLHSSNVVFDENERDEDCITVQWKDDKGEHKYRFLKPGIISQAEALTRLEKERESAKVKTIFQKNFPTTFNKNITKIRDFVRHRSVGDERPRLYIITGPYRSGKSFIADVMIAATGGWVRICGMDLFGGGANSYVDEALKERKLMVCFELPNEEKALKRFSELAQKSLFSTDVLLIISNNLLQELDRSLININTIFIECEKSLLEDELNNLIREDRYISSCARYIRK